MPGFAITPMGVFPPASDDGFPRFLQFQWEGENIGDTAVETVNFTGDVAVTLSSDGSTLTVDVAPRPFEWTDVPGDYTVTSADSLNGLATTGTSGTQTITLPEPASAGFIDGDRVLVFVEGDSGVEFVTPSGVDLLYRSALTNAAAGRYATMTAIVRGSNWILCGDLAYAES